jgi:hypothetical protein
MRRELTSGDSGARDGSAHGRWDRLQDLQGRYLPTIVV